ncbi:MAG: hypothetical protein AAB909_04945 [Patescibacteria group bacterium]
MDESGALLSELDARRESVSTKMLADAVARNRALQSPTEKDYQGASTFLDDIKHDSPEAYHQKLGADNSIVELVNELGLERTSILVAEMNHEKDQLAAEYSPKVKVGAIIDNSGVTGLAINNLSHRPTFKNVTPEQWGKVFAFNHASQRLAELMPTQKP